MCIQQNKRFTRRDETRHGRHVVALISHSITRVRARAAPPCPPHFQTQLTSCVIVFKPTSKSDLISIFSSKAFHTSAICLHSRHSLQALCTILAQHRARNSTVTTSPSNAFDSRCHRFQTTSTKLRFNHHFSFRRFLSHIVRSVNRFTSGTLHHSHTTSCARSSTVPTSLSNTFDIRCHPFQATTSNSDSISIFPSDAFFHTSLRSVTIVNTFTSGTLRRIFGTSFFILTQFLFAHIF